MYSILSTHTTSLHISCKITP